MYKIVNGKEFKGAVNNKDKYFYNTSGRKTEDEYKQLIIDSQEYFEKIKLGFISVEEDYFIYAPQEYINSGVITAEKVSNIRESGGAVNGMLLYCTNPIRVEKRRKGYYFASTDGRHRFIVAQKYKLNLLVDVVDKSPNNLIRNESFLKRLFTKLFGKRFIVSI